jgi:long-subunit acyl-CoA synthetase (AMP-forming)
MLMTGYHGRPDLTAQAVRDGWLHSGDLGYVDEDCLIHRDNLVLSNPVNP